MGWASAGGIFDPVAQALIDVGAPAAVKRKVLVTLIDKLRDGDWDTWEESLEHFADPATVSAFYTAVGGLVLDGCDEEGRISYDERSDAWVLSCQVHGELDYEGAALDHVKESTRAHDHLIRQWFRHDEEAHSGDGQVLARYLIGGE